MLQVSNEARQESGRAASTAEAAREMIDRADAVLLDWDGCVAIGNRPQPEAIRFLARHGDRVAIVSNNSANLPQDFAQILADAGAPLPPQRILLAGTEALARAVEIGASRVLVLGNSRMKAYGRNLGLALVNEDADLVVLLRDTNFSYARLERAVNSLHRGAKLLVANPDTTHPGTMGRLVPETGALLAALLACIDVKTVETEVVGKPFPRLFQRAVAALAAQGSPAVMIGDNPATDIAGAAAFGLQGLLIGPETGLSFQDLLDPPSVAASLPASRRTRSEPLDRQGLKGGLQRSR